MQIVKFIWLMHKKTMVGVQRFEDLIHAKFEELVLLGFLKPRGPAAAAAPGSAAEGAPPPTTTPGLTPGTGPRPPPPVENVCVGTPNEARFHRRTLGSKRRPSTIPSHSHSKARRRGC